MTTEDDMNYDDEYIAHIGHTMQDMQELELPSPVTLCSYWQNGEPVYLLTVRFGPSTFTLAMEEEQIVHLSNAMSMEVQMMHHDDEDCDCGGCTGEYN